LKRPPTAAGGSAATRAERKNAHALAHPEKRALIEERFLGLASRAKKYCMAGAMPVPLLMISLRTLRIANLAARLPASHST
jgi:hypothetical protein